MGSDAPPECIERQVMRIDNERELAGKSLDEADRRCADSGWSRDVSYKHYSYLFHEWINSSCYENRPATDSSAHTVLAGAADRKIQ